jgi:hypothetical protein
MKDYSFKVETIEAGQRKSYGDSFYTYKVTSKGSVQNIRDFCMGVLKKCCEKKDMITPFDGELLEFKTLSDVKSDYMPNKEPITCSYKVKMMYTG